MVTKPYLDDVILEPSTKKELEDILEGFEFEQLYKAHGVLPNKTFLFHGPPGTGKTLSVRAIVNELERKGKKVLYMPYNIGEFGTAYINMGAVNLNRLFRTGRKAVEKGQFREVERVEYGVDGEEKITTRLEPIEPYDVVAYQFDECDAIMGHRGSSSTHKEDDKLLEELMKQLQIIHDRPDTKELVFFMTNFYAALDQAAIRRGRVDKRIIYEMPSTERREDLLRHQMLESNRRAGYEMFRPGLETELSKKTNGFSYADLDSMVGEMVREHVRQYILSRNKVKGSEKVSDATVNKVLEEYTSQKRGVKKNRIGFV